ncbi:MAG: hypothetical protein SFV54_04110 [Bryobacteraceae bacterium]|nr:hypothetical protein [Bryobacteraceae bacterium]
MHGNGNGNGSKRSWWMPWTLWKKADEDLHSYRRLALQLHYDLAAGAEPRSAVVVTPDVTGLAARSSLNLAVSMAEQVGRRILLVDACPQDPKLSEHFEAGAAYGLSEYLSAPGAALDSYIAATTVANLSFLPAGTAAGSPVAPERIAQFLAEASARYDFVFLAGGSALNHPLSLAFAPHVGCVLLAVVEHQTSIDDLDAAQIALSHCKARRVRLVLASVDRWSGRARANAASQY